MKFWDGEKRERFAEKISEGADLIVHDLDEGAGEHKRCGLEGSGGLIAVDAADNGDISAIQMEP